MKVVFFMLSAVFLAGQVWASQDELKVQFPEENGRHFLASTAEEIGQHIDQKTRFERGQALCEHLGYKRVVKVSSTIFPVEVLSVNVIQDGQVEEINLKKDYTYIYSYNHAVINDLECSNVGEGGAVALRSLSNVGREIALEKGTRNNSKIRSFRSIAQ